MLNLKSDRASIEFEFVGEERKFVVADWKRKNVEETLPSTTAMVWKDEMWIPLTFCCYILIIGLTYETLDG
jgi:hypothetical protein